MKHPHSPSAGACASTRSPPALTFMQPRPAFAGLFSTLLFALAALFLSVNAFATDVTIAVTGTLTSGTDVTNVFGFGTNADLTGKTVTITYTVDPTVTGQTHSCTPDPYDYECTSGASDPLDSAVISIAGGGSYTDDSAISVSRSMGGKPPYYTEALGSTDTTMTVEGFGTSSATAQTPDMDWRTAFSDNTTLDPYLTSSNAGFSINDGTNQASGGFTVTAITESGWSCSSTSVAMTIPDASSDSSLANYPQPNILGGTVNISTTADIIVSGLNSPWQGISFGDTDATDDEAFASGAIPDANGDATVYYGSALAAAQANDKLAATTCGTSSSQVPIYNYYPPLDSGNGIYIDVGQSQVSDTTFTNSSDLSATNIETFFENVVDNGFLARFYIDDNSGHGGWVISSATGDSASTYNGSDPKYCEGVKDDQCPSTGDTGTYAASYVASAASTASINPKLLLTKLQVEHSLNSAMSKPSDSVLNFAAGCGSSSNFVLQLSCSANKFHTYYIDDPSEPYFKPIDTVNDSVQYAYQPSVTCEDYTLVTGCDLVGFTMENAATYAQYKYTPFVQTSTAGGGVRLFETIWYGYDSNGWYQ